MNLVRLFIYRILVLKNNKTNYLKNKNYLIITVRMQPLKK